MIYTRSGPWAGTGGMLSLTRDMDLQLDAKIPNVTFAGVFSFLISSDPSNIPPRWTEQGTFSPLPRGAQHLVPSLRATSLTEPSCGPCGYQVLYISGTSQTISEFH